MTNPIHDSMDEHFRGRRVRVVSNDGEVYVGWCERIHHRDRHVVLRDARDPVNGRDHGPVFVSHADTISALDDESRIDRVAIDDVDAAPWSAGEWAARGNRGYIRDVRDQGFVGSYPVVRPVDGEYEIVEGHKRLWVAEQAGLTTHPVEVVDVNDWELARRFVVDHLPDEEQVHDDGTATGCYDDAQIETVIDRLTDEWGERAFALPQVQFNADRLGFDIDGDATEQEGQLGDTADDTDDEATDADVEVAVDDDEVSELPPTGEEVLAALAEHGELPSAELKQVTQRSLQAISTNLNDLEEMGGVE